MVLSELKNIANFLPQKTEEGYTPISLDDDNKKNEIFPGSLPTLNMFKIALPNKKCKELIEDLWAPLKISDFKKYHECIKFT